MLDPRSPEYYLYVQWFGERETCASTFDELSMTCRWFKQGKFNKREFLTAVKELFRDDNGENWIDCPTSLTKLSNAVLSEG